jgi:hypothetical protein
MAFTIEPFQAVSVVLLKGLLTCYFCLLFARWRGIWDTRYHLYDFLISWFLWEEGLRDYSRAQRASHHALYHSFALLVGDF